MKVGPQEVFRFSIGRYFSSTAGGKVWIFGFCINNKKKEEKQTNLVITTR